MFRVDAADEHTPLAFLVLETVTDTAIDPLAAHLLVVQSAEPVQQKPGYPGLYMYFVPVQLEPVK